MCHDLAKAKKAKGGKKGETQIWLGDLRVAVVVFVFVLICELICHLGAIRILFTHIFTPYAIVRTESSAFSATPEEKKTSPGMATGCE